MKDELIKILQNQDLLDNKTYEQQADEILNLFNLFNVSQNSAYKKCECGKMKMVGVQCKDPRTGQCDKDTRYIKDFYEKQVH